MLLVFRGEIPAADSLDAVFWNLENFFDWTDRGGGESDKEFSSFGARHWSKRKFTQKCEAISKAVYWIAGRNSRLPDIFCVAEVENKYVLGKLLEITALHKAGYEIVHYDSPDTRGIDVALMYRPGELELLGSKPVRVHPPAGKDLSTRDMLLCQFRRRSDGAEFSVVVNHHPSKYGGGESDWKREIVVGRLHALCDSLLDSGEEEIIATGDFNDTPENPVLAKVSPTLLNLALPLAERGEGSIRFDGKWELIDMFLVSERLSGSRMEVLRIPFLLTRDKAHGGDKPLRTYAGPRFLGGVSDHLPVFLRFSP